MFIWVNEREERLADEKVRLLLKMAREHGVKVDEVEIRVEESPVCDASEREKDVFKPEDSERCERSMNDRQEMTYSSEFLRLSVTRLRNDRGGGGCAGAAGRESGASGAGGRTAGARRRGYRRRRGSSSGPCGGGKAQDGGRTLAGEDRENSCQQIAAREGDCDRGAERYYLVDERTARRT